MSGHSKWAQIKRQKGVADVKKGKTFTKLANAISIAVKQGGGIGDPSQNFRLRLTIDAAKTSNMPKENIERAIKRAMSREEGVVEEVIYEGFAPGGVSIMIEAVTDNSQRTTSIIKALFNKQGATFGQPGSVAYQFKQVGQIVVNKNGKSFDDIFSVAVNNGAEDIEEVEDQVILYTFISDMIKTKEELSKEGFEIAEAELIRIPTVFVKIEDPDKRAKIESFMESIEELDDVQKVYSNME